MRFGQIRASSKVGWCDDGHEDEFEMFALVTCSPGTGPWNPGPCLRCSASWRGLLYPGQTLNENSKNECPHLSTWYLAFVFLCSTEYYSSRSDKCNLAGGAYQTDSVRNHVTLGENQV